jgi:hypothetical protein
VERFGQLADGVLAIGQQSQHPTARDVPKRMKDSIELGFL